MRTPSAAKKRKPGARNGARYARPIPGNAAPGWADRRKISSADCNDGTAVVLDAVRGGAGPCRVAAGQERVAAIERTDTATAVDARSLGGVHRNVQALADAVAAACPGRGTC